MSKKKGTTSKLPFPIRMALRAAVKKHAKTPEEQEKVMQALDSLDLNTLLYDPDALMKVMNDPSGELRNFVKEGVDVDAEVDAASESENEIGADEDDADSDAENLEAVVTAEAQCVSQES